MLRAMTDLVCASSACPDDIDPSNAWEVTDVHVRVYSPENRFSVAIARRVTADAPAVLTRETAFHPRDLAQLTKSFVEYRGYWLPHCFNNEGGDRRVLGLSREARADGPLPAAQVGSARARCGDADAARRHARRAQAVGRPGRLHRAVQRDRRDDRRRDRVPTRTGQLPLRRRRRVRRRSGCGQVAEREAGLRAWVKPSTDELHNLALQGPESRDGAGRDRVDAADPAEPRGAQVVPLSRRADRRL